VPFDLLSPLKTFHSASAHHVIDPTETDESTKSLSPKTTLYSLLSIPIIDQSQNSGHADSILPSQSQSLRSRSVVSHDTEYHSARSFGSVSDSTEWAGDLDVNPYISLSTSRDGSDSRVEDNLHGVNSSRNEKISLPSSPPRDGDESEEELRPPQPRRAKVKKTPEEKQAIIDAGLPLDSSDEDDADNKQFRDTSSEPESISEDLVGHGETGSDEESEGKEWGRDRASFDNLYDHSDPERDEQLARMRKRDANERARNNSTAHRIDQMIEETRQRLAKGNRHGTRPHSPTSPASFDSTHDASATPIATTSHANKVGRGKKNLFVITDGRYANLPSVDEQPSRDEKELIDPNVETEEIIPINPAIASFNRREAQEEKSIQTRANEEEVDRIIRFLIDRLQGAERRGRYPNCYEPPKPSPMSNIQNKDLDHSIQIKRSDIQEVCRVLDISRSDLMDERESRRKWRSECHKIREAAESQDTKIKLYEKEIQVWSAEVENQLQESQHSEAALSKELCELKTKAQNVYQLEDQLLETQQSEASISKELEEMKTKLQNAYKQNLETTYQQASLGDTQDERLAIAMLQIAEQSKAIEDQRLAYEQTQQTLINKIEDLEDAALRTSIANKNAGDNADRIQDLTARHKTEIEKLNNTINGLKEKIKDHKESDMYLREVIRHCNTEIEKLGHVEKELQSLQQVHGLSELEIERLGQQNIDLEVKLGKSSQDYTEDQIRDYAETVFGLEARLRVAKRDEAALKADYIKLREEHDRRFHERNVYLAQLRDTETIADAATQGGTLPEELTDDRKILHNIITALKLQIQDLRRDVAFKIHNFHYQASQRSQDSEDVTNVLREMEEEYLQEIWRLRGDNADLMKRLADLEVLRWHDLATKPWVDQTKYEELQKTNEALNQHTEELQVEVTKLKDEVTSLERNIDRQNRSINDQVVSLTTTRRALDDLQKSYDALNVAHNEQERYSERQGNYYVNERHDLKREIAKRDKKLQTMADEFRKYLYPLEGEANAQGYGLRKPSNPSIRSMYSPLLADVTPKQIMALQAEVMYHATEQAQKKMARDANWSATKDFDARNGYPNRLKAQRFS
jgi:hypothetical protein